MKIERTRYMIHRACNNCARNFKLPPEGGCAVHHARDNGLGDNGQDFGEDVMRS